MTNQAFFRLIGRKGRPRRLRTLLFLVPSSSDSQLLIKFLMRFASSRRFESLGPQK